MPKSGGVEVKQQGNKIVVSVTIDPEQVPKMKDGKPEKDADGKAVMVEEDLTLDVRGSCQTAVKALRRQIEDDIAAEKADAQIEKANAAKAKGRLSVS